VAAYLFIYLFIYYYAIRQPDIVIQHDTAIQKLKKHKTTQKYGGGFEI